MANIEEKDKIVDFSIWCRKCVSRSIDGDQEPCSECLDYPVTESGLPINFKKKE